MRSPRAFRALTVAMVLAATVLLGAGTAAAQDVDGGTLAPGVPVTATLAAGDDMVYGFSATAGEHVTFDVEKSTWDYTAPGNGIVRLRLIDPSGVERTACAMERDDYWCELTPGVSGTWTARLDPGVGSRGTITFGLWPDPPKSTMTEGKAVTTTIVHRGNQVRYAFAVKSLRHHSFDTSNRISDQGAVIELVFYDPAGTRVASCSAFETWCDLSPAVTGSWTVAVVPRNGNTGRITMVYRADVTGPAVTAGASITTKTVIEGQDGAYAWRPSAGVPATFRITSATWRTGRFAYLRFLDATGTARKSCVVQRGPDTCAFTPVTGGLWKIVVDPYGTETGTMVWGLS